jgi:hypothetical protein|tara:strand:+ start:186 stop:668 length:483 start_codon:yes stop_codon:yes gene_type:complete
MNEYKLKEAYAEWVNKESYDLFITLNSERELSYEKMSELVLKLFYKTECTVFGYKQRERYKKTLRIKRLVAIEHYNKRTHAHIQVKTLQSFTNEQMIELLRLEYMALLNTKREKSFLFNATQIANRDAVSRYITKETNKQNRKLNDVIDLRSSFISKAKQ